MQNKKLHFSSISLVYLISNSKNLISILLEKGYRQLIIMNEKHAGVPVLLYDKTTTSCFSDLSHNGNLYVLMCARTSAGARARANDARNNAQ